MASFYLTISGTECYIQIIQEYEDLYPGVDGLRKTYLGMVTAMDDFVANVTEELKSAKLYDNTVIIFISDNGANDQLAGSNVPLKGRKGQFYEGGVRTPSFIHSPLLSRSK